MPIEVDWDQLATPEQARLYVESWPEIYFKPVIEALRDTSERTKYLIELLEKSL